MPVSPGVEDLPAKAAALIVLDGWGLAADGPVDAGRWRPRGCPTICGRAIRVVVDRLRADVGLPEGQMGDSEVGHANLGAGALVVQDMTRIDEAAENGTLADNRVSPVWFCGQIRSLRPQEEHPHTLPP